MSLLQVEQSSRAATAASVATAAEAASGSVSASGAVAVRNRLSRLGRFEQKRREEERREGGLDLVQPFPSQSLFPTYLWDWFVPESSCADLDRVGRIGDGGKWTCGVQDLARREVTPAAAAGLEEPACVVFSYGVGPELSFEAELAELAPACVLHVFDPTVPGLAREASRLRQAELLPTHGGARAAGGAADDPGATGPAGATQGGRRRMSFEKVGLAGRSGGIKASGSAAFPWVENLTDAMQRLGTSFIDILKVDVEGAEYDALIPLLERRRPGADPPLFGQLLIELHVDGAEKYASNGTSARNVFRLMHLLHEHGYQIFSKELNLGPPAKHDLPVAIEYSFLHPGAWAARQRGAAAGAAAAPAGARPLRPPPTARRQLSLLAVEEGGAPGARVEGGGAIYFVSHAGRLQGLREALLALHEQFNRQFRYPVVVFHENITAAQRRALEAAVTEDLYPLKFMDVSEIWAAAPLPRGRATTPELCRCSSETSTLGYRKMIYFQAFLAHDILSKSLGYEWLWRLDDDSRLTAPVGYDPFRLMAANGWRYGTVAAVGDEAACVEGLWELASKFVADAQRKEPDLLPHGPDFFDQMLPGYVFYNNFEISHVSLWQSPVYRRWRDAVLEHGGIFTRRWGDAPIRTIGVAMQMKVPGSGPPRLANSSNDLEKDAGELHFFEDIGYQHWPFVSQEPRGLGAPRLQWQLQQQQQQQQASGGRVQLSSSWHNGTRRKEKMMKDPHGRNFAGGGDGAEVSEHLARTTNGTAEGALPAGLLAALDGRYSLAHSVGPMSRMPVVRLPPQALVPLEEGPGATTSLAKLRGSGNGKNSSSGGQQSLRNGIVYCLISSLMSGRNVSRLLTSLGENFLQSWPYPFVIFFDVEDEAAAHEAAAAVQELAARYRKVVQGQEVPCHYQARRLQHGNGTELRYGARIEGAWLPFPVRLWATPFGASLWQVEAQSLRLVDLLAFEERYDWLWRVDVTGEVPEPITLDPFAAMEQRGARYGYNYVVQELESKLQGDLWQKGLDVARGAWAKLRREEQDGQGEADGASTGEPDGVLLFKNWPKGRIFITSCEVSHASVWSHPAARTLLQHFLRSPDFSKFQWSDAALHTLAVLASVADHRELWDMAGLPYADLLVQWRRPRRPGAIEVPPAAAAAASASAPSAPPPDLRFRQLLLLPQTSQAQVLAEVPVRPVAKLETFGWLGGDVGTSLLLPSPSSPTTGPPQRLWLFGDTLLGTSRRGVRTQLHKVLHHSIGRSPSSRGEDLRKGRQPTFEWGLREDEAGDVESSDIFACSLDEAHLTAPPSSSSSSAAAAAASEGCFYWPLTGIAVLHRDGAGRGSGAVGLVLVAAKVQKKPGPNNETTDSILGHSVIAVRNPEDHASRWEWSAKEISGPLARYAWAAGLAAADGAPWASANEEGDEQRGGWVYMLGRTTAHEGRRKRTKAWPFSSWRTEGAAVLARAKAEDLLALRLDGVELLTSGNSSGSPWRRAAEGEAAAAGGLAAKELFKPAEAESSLIWAESLGSWLTVGLDEGRGGTAATLRAAQRPEGPWGPAAAVARLPEELLGLGECYAPKLHPVEAAAADAAASSSSASSATTTVSMSLVCAPIFTDPQELVELPAKAYVPQLAQVELLLARDGASSLSSSSPQGRSSLA